MNPIAITPRTTEKAYGLSGDSVYVFTVPLSANKQAIARAVEAQYEVKVVSVTTLVQNGKTVRYSRGKNRYPGKTTRSDSKKAYVRLAKGESIPVFATESAEEEKK